MGIDLNNRDYADQTVRVSFFPRADAYYKVQPLEFEPYESEKGDRAGWKLIVEILEAEAGKTNPLFEPVSAPGRKHIVTFDRLLPQGFLKDQNMFELRQFLAACMGEVHSPEFEANGPLSQLEEMQDLSELDPILLHTDAYSSKPKKDGEDAGRIYVNVRNVFEPIG